MPTRRWLSVVLPSSLVMLTVLQAPLEAQPTPTEPEPAPPQQEPAPTPSEPAPTQPEPAPTQPEPAPTQPEPAPTQPEPAPTQPEPAPTQPELAPTIVVALPGHESGQTVRATYSTSTNRVIARNALFLPRSLLEIALKPFEGVLWLYDRYALRNLYYRTFYNEDRTFGIVPIVVYATGFGIMGGARLISTDTFGDGERLTIEGAYGGTYQDRASLWLDSGRRLEPVRLTVGGNVDRFARLAFFGIGNADEITPPPSMPLIDPLVNDTAVKSYFRYRELRAAATADWRVIDDLHLIGRGAFTDLAYDPSTREPPINAVYDPVDLVGFMNGVTHLYGEFEARWDRRRIARPRWETTEYTTGWLASAYAGGVLGLKDSSDFVHYGFDMQAFLHLALGPRMLSLRLRGEGVTGELDEVPFSELPYLGGDVMRGYQWGRFRDRVAAVATAQYTWDLSRFTNAFLFVDAGRVYRALDDLTFSDMRLGFGGGVELHTETDFVISGTIASSKDGGLFITAQFIPLWDKVPKWR